jgi:CysZ protein
VKRPGFFGGVAALFRGVGFIVGTPSMWGYAAVPIAVALMILTGLGWLFVHVAGRAVDTLVGPAHAARVEHALLTVGLDVAALLVALLVALSLAQPFSGWALDRIISAEERALGVPPREAHGAFGSALRSLGATLLALSVGLPAVGVLTLVGVLFPPATVVTVPLKFVVSALLIAWDLLDYPLGRRGLGVVARTRWVRQNFGAALGFGLMAALLLVVPCAGLLVLPFGVAGAARLALDAERSEVAKM